MSVTTDTLLPDRPRRRHDEETTHRAVWRYLQWALPDDAVAYHPANGGKRHHKAAARMSALGVVPGVPDLAVIWRGKALFLELKTGRAVVSPAQRSFHRKLAYCGAPVAVCRSVEEAEAALRAAGLPLRATVSGWMGERLA